MATTRTSTARRPARPGTHVLTVVLGFLAVVIVVLHLCRETPKEPAPAPIPTPVSTPEPSPVAPTPTPTPTSTPEVTSIVESTPTPTPTPTLIPIPTRKRRNPNPPAGIDQCVSFGWTLTGATPTLNQIFVQIDATNRCGRRLGPDEIWFEVSGIRNGSVEHRVLAHPFDEVWPGRTVRVSVGLQGSVDWYDEIRVVLIR